MGEHPIRLIVTDDLKRSRLTTFFRAILAIPLFIWVGLWGVAALVAALVNWLATLARGRSPVRLHRFLAAYVKYATHFYAYVHLVAEDYPSFDGADGYPIDLQIAPPARQRRWSVALRGVLLLPAALLVAALVGDPTSGNGRGGNSFSVGIGVLAASAFIAWFAILARGRTSRGLRDAAAYALLYGAQFWAYALLLTDRYPNSDPIAALPSVPVGEGPIHLRIDERWSAHADERGLAQADEPRPPDGLRRSRLTVLFRLPLSAPHFVWLALWGLAALLAAIVNWLATTLAGRSPRALHRFLSAYLRYQFDVYAFVHLVANPFPGFVGRAGSYPVEVAVADRARQSRWKSGFRLVLAVPALIMSAAFWGLLVAVAALGWLSSLARGRMPLGLRNAGALALRYHAQTVAYLMLLSDSYPYSGPTRRAT